MTKIKSLIIDDEPRAHKILENYIEKTAALELSGNCYNAVEAVAILKEHPVDLIFLDITMPEVDGFAFLRMLERPPFVIFTTAHSEFALESYEYNAVDYLKKPIPYERFLKAIEKLTEWKEKGMSLSPVKEFIEVKVDGTNKEVALAQILYIQSMGNYIKIFFEDKAIVTQVTTKEFEDILPKSLFIRIHKSYIVSKSKITTMMDEELVVGNIKLPVGKTFKKYVREQIHLA